MEFSATVSIPDLSQLDGKKVMAALHAHAPEIEALIKDRIEARTPVLTGALREDVESKDGSGPELVQWYMGTAYQEAEWHRVYGAYQEGGALGLSTYTNGPHEMFAQVATTDLPLIEAWANRAAEEGVNDMTNAAIAGTQVLEL